MIVIKRALKILLISSFILFSFTIATKITIQSNTLKDDNNVLLGYPSSKNKNTNSNLIIDKDYYVISYNQSRAAPDWVSWHLSSSDLGAADRQNNFRPDEELPSSSYKVRKTSYTGTGFDRGHNCPSADRTNSIEANSSTFLMTNMLPQAPNLNRRTWANLEDYTRDLIRSGYEAYIIMGSYGNGGIGAKGYTSKIDYGRIAVSSNVWKVIVILPQGNNDLNRINTRTRVIAVNTLNRNSVSSNWRLYLTTVNAIEEATGYDLFSNLSNSLQMVLESKVDIQ